MIEAIAVMLSCEQTAACPADMAPTAHHLLLLHGPWLLVKLEQGWDRAHCPQARPCLCFTGCDRTCCLAEGEMSLLTVSKGNTSRGGSSTIPPCPQQGPAVFWRSIVPKKGWVEMHLMKGCPQVQCDTVQGTETQDPTPQSPSWMRLGHSLWRGPKCLH